MSKIGENNMKLRELGFIQQEKPPGKYEKIRKKIKARDRRLGINDMGDMTSLLRNTIIGKTVNIE